MTSFIKNHRQATALVSSGLLVFNLLLQAIVYPQLTQAAAFTYAVVRYDRMKTSTATNVRVLIRPATTAVENKLRITFPAGFTVGAATVNTTGVTVDAGVTAMPGTLTVANAGQVITVSGITDLTVGTTYGVNIATGITTPGSANAYDVIVASLTSADAIIDSTTVTTRVITDDQIVVSASVGATFTFALSANVANIGALDSGSVSASSPVTATITTNAASGWYLWARDANNNGSGRGSLQSTASGARIAGSAAPGTASAVLSAGTEGYGMGATVTHNAGTGTPSVTAAYDGATNKVGTLDPTQHRLVSSSNGTATGTGDVTSLIFRASISTSTSPASDYSDIVTVVAAGSF